MKPGLILHLVHRWLALFVGIQIVLWITSGLVMSWFSLSTVRGEDRAPIEAPLELDAATYVSPGGVIASVDGATSLTLKGFLDRTVYEVETFGGKALFDAQTGAKLSPISDAMARTVRKLNNSVWRMPC